jgi:hypothetical protein
MDNDGRKILHVGAIIIDRTTEDLTTYVQENVGMHLIGRCVHDLLGQSDPSAERPQALGVSIAQISGSTSHQDKSDRDLLNPLSARFSVVDRIGSRHGTAQS